MKSAKEAKLLLASIPFLLAMAGCSSQTVVLINPKNGATAKCAATGAGVGASWSQYFIDNCIREYETSGYVALDKLTPAERAELERRGWLPKE